MLYTTARKAREAGACFLSYYKMAKALGGIRKYGKDTPVPLNKVLKVCGLDDALWCLRIVIEPADKEIRLFVCDCAERVLPIFETRYPDDKRPRQAIEASRKFANSEITIEELAAAGDAVWAARAAAGDAVWAAYAASAAAMATTMATTMATEGAAYAARAAGAVAVAAEREWQTQRLLKLLNSSSVN